MQTITTVRGIIDDAVKRFSKNTAFTLKKVVNDKVTYKNISYAQFGEDIRNLTTAFMAKGMDRIAVIGKNSYDWLVCYYATICSGGVTVPLDKGLTPVEIKSCLLRSEAQALVFDSDHLPMIREFCEDPEFAGIGFICMDCRAGGEEDLEKFRGIEPLKAYKRMGRELREKGDKRYETKAVHADDVCAILFTSGTTSAAKAVMLTQNNIASDVYGLQINIKFYESDVNMAFLPLHHTFGSTSVTLLLSHGASTVFCDGLKYVQQNLKEYKVSVFIAVPLLIEGIYNKVIKQAKKQGKYEKLKKGYAISEKLLRMKIRAGKKIFAELHEQFGGNMRMVVSGASALNPDVAKAYNVAGVIMVQGYGLTETSPSISGDRVHNICYNSVGYPLRNVEVRIEDPDETGTGEIVVRGPMVMKGYYKDAEETAKVLKDGWFYTGDLGYLGKDGHLFVKGRKKNVIVLKNGKNVYPEELEEMLGKIPYVTESLVYGAEKGDDLAVSAKIVYDKAALLKEKPNLAKLVEDDQQALTHELIKAAIGEDVEAVNAQMPSFKSIRRFEVTEIPMEKTTTAKIKRYKEIEKLQA